MILSISIREDDAILDKVHEDPESEEVKGVEIRLWEKIKQKAKEGRRTGVGITAEGDMLAALGLRYGSEEAIDFAVDIQKTLAVEAYRASVHLAKDRGSFKIYDTRREENNPFIKPLTRGRSRYVCRNGEVRTPEYCLSDDRTNRNDKPDDSDDFRYRPVFLPVYKRRRKVNPNDQNVHIDFVDESGDSYEEFIVFHHKFADWMKANGYDTTKCYTDEEIDELVAQSPYYKATSNDID